VTAEGEFAGGVIAPGFRAMTDYMNERTALLPRIPFDGVCMRIGRSTVEAMTIGARIGYRGLIREIVEYLVKGNHLRNPTLVATGGLARIALANSGLPFHIDQTLTLKALLDIFRLNVRTSKQG
jgi:type III pantothenate kinase